MIALWTRNEYRRHKHEQFNMSVLIDNNINANTDS